jgi:hypothetical protein
MHAVTLVSSSLASSDPDYPPVPKKTVRGICAITGEESDCLPREDVLPATTFNDVAALAAPESRLCSVAAYVAMKYKWERQSAWICDGQTFRRLDRQGVRAYVVGERDQPARPWAGHATTSYKKHGSIYAPVNGPARNVWRFDDLTVDCSDRVRVTEWWQRLNAELRHGFGRQILESGEVPPYLAKKLGIARALELESWMADKVRSALYRFLCYLLPSQEELKKETAA